MSIVEPFEGIAITSLTSGNGTWQYSLNGTTWTNVGTVADNSALLLRSSDLVRFVPNGQTGTTAEFTFRAWDQSSGSAGNKVDATTNGGTTAFSTATEVASITVTSVNDAPSSSVVTSVASGGMDLNIVGNNGLLQASNGGAYLVEGLRSLLEAQFKLQNPPPTCEKFRSCRMQQQAVLITR